MEKILIVEQGRINWNGEYLPITYTPVDNQKTAAFVLKEALKEYKGQPGTKVTKLKEGIYEIRIKCTFAEDEVYYLHVKELSVIDLKTAKDHIKTARETKAKADNIEITYDIEG